ncbi:4-(cytidine 5'-diphospho)-2-C-methyl-D-erythritol kinase [Hoeflea sp.]|uniref:4-(cytidine 5'-diphospho)-2-C-methyl-D-erythritol kinase n=1 Tax=Hoeflea sp. TaxID=1940281 RepID=UPI003B52613F
MQKHAGIEVVDAPAKINLALHVTGRRDDGYHLIETLAVFTTLGDRLSAEFADEDRFSIGGPEAGPLLGDAAQDNLVCRARDALRSSARATGRDAAPVHLHLEKRLPVASGMGGGSADAAAALRLLSTLWGLETDNATLNSIGLELGADVPMCLSRRPLIARGIGERLTPVEIGFPLDLVIVNPRVPVSTPVVFKGLQRRDNPPLPSTGNWGNMDRLLSWLGETRNDLEPPALSAVAEIQDCIDALRDTGARFARMSGSGASCFGIFEDQRSAEAAARAIQDSNPGWFVAATATLPPDTPDGR